MFVSGTMSPGAWINNNWTADRPTHNLHDRSMDSKLTPGDVLPEFLLHEASPEYCFYVRFRPLYEVEVAEPRLMARVLAGEEPHGISCCVHGGGRSMLRPLHDVPGAGEVSGGLGRPPQPTYGVFGERRRAHLVSWRDLP